MSVKALVVAGSLSLGGLMTLCAPGRGYCEEWIEFHTENWSYKSKKTKKKLKIKNIYAYDGDSLTRDKNGDVSLWVRESTDNDRFYVVKGVPEQETVFKNIRIRCGSKKYDILHGEGDEAEYSESMSEAILPGSCYDKLQAIICKPVN